MTNLMMSRDFNDFTNHEIKVVEAAIKQQKENRDKIFMSQFSEGTPIAVTTNFKDEDGNYMVYPAYITKVNKKSIKISWAVDSQYNPKSAATNWKTWKLDTVKRHVQNGYLLNALPSKWINPEAKQFNNYPAFIQNTELPKEWL